MLKTDMDASELKTLINLKQTPKIGCSLKGVSLSPTIMIHKYPKHNEFKS